MKEEGGINREGNIILKGRNFAGGTTSILRGRGRNGVMGREDDGKGDEERPGGKG